MSRRFVPVGRHLRPGLIAVGLFATLALTVLTAGNTGVLESAFTDPTGFGDASVVPGIGYALIGEPAAAGAEAVHERTESFLLALVLLAVVLDAAIDGALMLADRRDGGDNE